MGKGRYDMAAGTQQQLSLVGMDASTQIRIAQTLYYKTYGTFSELMEKTKSGKLATEYEHGYMDAMQDIGNWLCMELVCIKGEQRKQERSTNHAKT